LLAFPSLSILLLQGACATGPGVPPPTEPPIEVKGTGAPGQAATTRSRSARLEVTALDLARRSISLRQPTGEVETMTVGAQVRLEEVAVGDSVVVEYTEGLMLEFQPADTRTVPPTAVKVEPRGVELGPAGGATGMQATVQVISIDYGTRLVVVEMPNGDRKWVKAGPGIRLENLTAGDRLLATYVQAIAFKLEKK
jgi:hypothetical protein